MKIQHPKKRLRRRTIGSKIQTKFQKLNPGAKKIPYMPQKNY